MIQIEFFISCKILRMVIYTFDLIPIFITFTIFLPKKDKISFQNLLFHVLEEWINSMNKLDNMEILIAIIL